MLCLLLDHSSLQNLTPFTGCSKKLLKIKGRANLLAFYLLEHPCLKGTSLHDSVIQEPSERKKVVKSESLGQTEACTQMEMARKHTAFYNIGFSEAKALFRQKLARIWGRSGMGDSSSGSPEGLRCSPLLCGRKHFF